MPLKSFVKSFVNTVLVIALLVFGYVFFSGQNAVPSQDATKTTSDTGSSSAASGGDLNPADIRRIIEGVIPAAHDAVAAKYFREDLDGDNQDEFIICSFPKIQASSTVAVKSFPVLTILARTDVVTQYQMVATATLTKSSLTHPPCSKTGNKFVDIDHDKTKELVLDLGYGGETIDEYGIYRLDPVKKNLTLMKLKTQTGKTTDAIIPVGATNKNGLAFSFQDIDGDGKRELIESTGTLVQNATDPSDPKSWNWQIEAFSWNGSLLAFDHDVSQQYVDQNSGTPLQP